MHSTVNGTKEFAALDPSKIAAIKGISQLALLKHFDNLQLAFSLITVFAAILTGIGKAVRSCSVRIGIQWQTTFSKLNFTQLTNHNVQIPGTGLYSSSLKNVGWIKDS